MGIAKLEEENKTLKGLFLEKFAKYKEGDWVEYTHTSYPDIEYTTYGHVSSKGDPVLEQEVGRISDVYVFSRGLSYNLVRPNGEQYTVPESSITGKITLPKPRKKK